MYRNIDSINRIIRLLGTAFILVFYFLELIPGVWALLLLVAGGILLLTSLVNLCSLYKILGLRSTKRIKE